MGSGPIFRLQVLFFPSKRLFQSHVVRAYPHSSSETQGQIVGARERLNGRKKLFSPFFTFLRAVFSARFIKTFSWPGPTIVDPKSFSWHNFRSGGASSAPNGGISDRMFKRHGRWRSENVKGGYVADSIESRLVAEFHFLRPVIPVLCALGSAAPSSSCTPILLYDLSRDGTIL